MNDQNEITQSIKSESNEKIIKLLQKSNFETKKLVLSSINQHLQKLIKSSVYQNNQIETEKVFDKSI